MDYAKVVEVVREEVLTEYLPNSCIAAARITTLALRRMGVHSEAMACALEALSPAYVSMVERAVELGHDPTEAEVDEWRERGAWRVSLNDSPAPEGVVDRRCANGYHGHVIVLAEGRTLLLDPTLAQIHRPEKGLVIEAPYLFTVEEDELERREVARLRNGVVLVYTLLPGRRDFTKAPDWIAPGEMRKRTQERIVNRVIHRLQRETAHAANHR